MMRFIAYLWALPNTLLGLIFLPVALLSAGKIRLIDGVLEIHGSAIRWLLGRAAPFPGGAMAITFGHVVLGCSELCLQQTRAHERIHVRQYERWGPLFIPAYLLSSLLAYFRGGSPYRDNMFERQAYGSDAS